MADGERASTPGCDDQCDAVSIRALVNKFTGLCDSLRRYSETHPHVENVDKLHRRACRELSALRHSAEPEDSGPLDAPVEICEHRLARRECHILQGFLNNFNGMHAEFSIAECAPDVVAISKRFRSGCLVEESGYRFSLQALKRRSQTEDQRQSTVDPSLNCPSMEAIAKNSSEEGVTLTGKQLKKSSQQKIAEVESPPEETCCKSGQGLRRLTVEVDVVAHMGHWWIEVKSQKPFGLDSVHWCGQPGHCKGLEQQVLEYLEVANSPLNWIRWQPPVVVILFTNGVTPEVAQKLTHMGAYPISGSLELSSVPPPPPPPEITNIDVTTMCALVSEVSHGGPSDPMVQQWAARLSHWTECLQDEANHPLMGQLSRFLSDRPLIACQFAVNHFEVLLGKFSGPKERQRWQELKRKLVVHHNEESMSDRVAALADVFDQQKYVFGLGDRLHATTLTANGKVVQKALQQGVHLEVFVHRAVWLTGL